MRKIALIVLCLSYSHLGNAARLEEELACRAELADNDGQIFVGPHFDPLREGQKGAYVIDALKSRFCPLPAASRINTKHRYYDVEIPLDGPRVIYATLRLHKSDRDKPKIVVSEEPRRHLEGPYVPLRCEEIPYCDMLNAWRHSRRVESILPEDL